MKAVKTTQKRLNEIMKKNPDMKGDNNNKMKSLKNCQTFGQFVGTLAVELVFLPNA